MVRCDSRTRWKLGPSWHACESEKHKAIWRLIVPCRNAGGEDVLKFLGGKGEVGMRDDCLAPTTLHVRKLHTIARRARKQRVLTYFEDGWYHHLADTERWHRNAGITAFRAAITGR